MSNNLKAPNQPTLAHQLDRVKLIKYILNPSDWQIPSLFMKIPCFMFFVTAVWAVTNIGPQAKRHKTLNVIKT